jgi:hypothetical protein
MDLFSLAIGIAVGAAFSPFWMKVYTWSKAVVLSKINSTPVDTTSSTDTTKK